jgi:hypothetical protein
MRWPIGVGGSRLAFRQLEKFDGNVPSVPRASEFKIDCPEKSEQKSMCCISSSEFKTALEK